MIEFKTSSNSFFFMRSCRRQLAEHWGELPTRRRVSCLKAMMEQPGKPGELEAIRRAADIPMSMWRHISKGDKIALLERCHWANMEPSPTPIFDTFHHRGTTYHAPAANFMNAVCVEYPMADEHLTAFLSNGDLQQLLLLTATLWREPNPDKAAAAKRDDFRVMLSGRAEVEARAAKLAGLPQEIQFASLLYFVGVKQLVQRMYGNWLFEPPDEEGDEPSAGDPLGWWGLYLDAASNDVTKLDAIHQSNFHNFCTMEVRRRKQIKDAEMRRRLMKND